MEKLEKIVARIIEANRGLIEERGINAFGLLMGVVMKKVWGKANAALASELIRKRLKQLSK